MRCEEERGWGVMVGRGGDREEGGGEGEVEGEDIRSAHECCGGEDCIICSIGKLIIKLIIG